MNLRNLVGSFSMFLFARQFITINKVPFDFHGHSQQGEPIDYQKGTYLISLKYFQHVLNKYDNPAVGDLIAYEQTDRTISFKVIEALPQSYYSEYSAGIIGFEYYVPNGFVVLRDPLTKSTKMQFIGNVRGNVHFPLRL